MGKIEVAPVLDVEGGGAVRAEAMLGRGAEERLGCVGLGAGATGVLAGELVGVLSRSCLLGEGSRVRRGYHVFRIIEQCIALAPMLQP